MARETLAVLRQNQHWALAYNLSAVPLAALGMSASSLVVVLNALRIGRDAAPKPAPVPVPAVKRRLA